MSVTRREREEEEGEEEEEERETFPAPMSRARSYRLFIGRERASARATCCPCKFALCTYTEREERRAITARVYMCRFVALRVFLSRSLASEDDDDEACMNVLCDPRGLVAFYRVCFISSAQSRVMNR